MAQKPVQNNQNETETPSIPGLLVVIAVIALAIIMRWHATGQWTHPGVPDMPNFAITAR